MSGWEEYLNYLDKGPHSVRLTTSNLSPSVQMPRKKRIRIHKLNYVLWPFQERILSGIGSSTLILGLPTGLGKTYLAGAKLWMESKKTPIRVIFLVPSVPLGIQQATFSREKLGVDAIFVSGGIPPERRRELKVWNNAFIVATPQTFYNDNLAEYKAALKEARSSIDPVSYLSEILEDFPFDIVVADECQRYIGETDGYSTLLAAKACGAKILALSATPQLHAKQRLLELKKVFDEIKTFSIEDPDIRDRVPERLLVVEQLETPQKLMKVYRALGELIRVYHFRIRKMYGQYHPRNCSNHPICRAQLAIRMLRLRLVEDGASGVLKYGTWKFRDLRNKRKSLDGGTIYNLYLDAHDEYYNHKLDAATRIVGRELFQKAIIYVESVEAAKQLADILQKQHGVSEVAGLVGKGDMSIDQQASALQHFREQARILVCTSVGEEGLDIPSADIEIWIDPPNNPRKWIQRFGRILRQPGEKKLARIYALVSIGTHEKKKLFNVKKIVEKTYGFTQNVEMRLNRPLQKGQRTMADYIK